MSFPRFCALAFVCLLGVRALGQDPIKVEPKHYKLDFENDKVQVVSVHYGPHEQSALHDHPGGVVVTITAGHLRFTDESGKTREVFAKPGEVRWYPPFKHKVENLGDQAYNAVYIGVKGNVTSVGANQDRDSAIPDEQAAKLVAEYLLSSAGR